MSSQPSVDVLPLEKKDRGRAGGALARAFYDTDQRAALFPDQRARQRQLEQMFGGTGKLIDAAGGVAERTPNFQAAAFWLAPGRSVGFEPPEEVTIETIDVPFSFMIRRPERTDT